MGGGGGAPPPPPPIQPTAAMTPAVLLEFVHGNDEITVIRDALKALNAQSRLANRLDELMQAGIIAACVFALTKHDADAEVCEWVCDMVYHVAQGAQGAGRCEAVVASGAVPLVAAVFATHGGEAKKYASYALEALGYQSNGSLMVTICIFFT